MRGFLLFMFMHMYMYWYMKMYIHVHVYVYGRSTVASLKLKGIDRRTSSGVEPAASFLPDIARVDRLKALS